MEIYRIIGIAIIGTAAAVVLRPIRPDMGMMVSLTCGIVILSISLGMIGQAVKSIELIFDRGGMEREHIQILLKCLGICIVSQIASDSCRDSGENSIASKVELAGKLSILIIGLPLFSDILSVAVDFLSV